MGVIQDWKNGTLTTWKQWLIILIFVETVMVITFALILSGAGKHAWYEREMLKQLAYQILVIVSCIFLIYFGVDAIYNEVCIVTVLLLTG